MSKKREAPPKPEELIQKLSERLDVVKSNLTGNDIFDGLVALQQVMTLDSDQDKKREFKIAIVIVSSAVQLRTVATFPSLLDNCFGIFALHLALILI